MSAGYFQTLKGTLHFEAHLETPETEITKNAGTTFAVNSAGYPVALEFLVGEGRICFLPPSNVNDQRIGAAILKVITAHFNKATDIDAPTWAGQVTVPGADIHDKQIAELRNRAEEIADQIAILVSDRDELLKYLRLLFGYGKAVLEPAVRSAFRLFGFVVAEPEDYEGEWDVDVRETNTERSAIGEVEGSEGAIGVDKYRQLLDYIDTEARGGRERKGILIGNGFRLLIPDSTERQNQFSDHALRGAMKNGFCLLPTTELFKAVCAVLESPNDEAMKAAIRESLLTIVGPWKFTIEMSSQHKAPAKGSQAPPTSTPRK